jgi:hypothetical protein
MGGQETLELVALRVLAEARLERPASPFVLAVAYGLRLRPVRMDGAELDSDGIRFDRSAPIATQAMLVARELGRALAEDEGLPVDAETVLALASLLQG